MASERRLIAMSEEQVERLRALHDIWRDDFRTEWEAALLRDLIDAYESSITEDEARWAANWIRGHRPPPSDELRVGRLLDRAVSKLRTLLTPDTNTEGDVA